jgi:glycosyltransferase involved in cell wall biosynthesis
MRVIHVITRLIVGGAQENTIASVLGLHAKPGLEVSLVTGPSVGPEGSLENAFSNCPALLTVLPSLVRPIHPWKDCLAWTRLTALFRARRPDIVHTHSSKAGVLGRLAAARAGVPSVVHTIHGPSFGAFQGAIANGVYRAAERYAARVTSHFVSVADAMTQQYLAAGIGRPDQYTTIFSGFDLAPFLAATNDLQLRAKLGLSAEDVVIGKVARLFKLKGHDDLLTIAPQLVQGCPRVKFLLVGDGLWRSRLEQKVRVLGLERHVVFTGLVPPEAIPPLMGVMDLLVHLSTREGLPRALPQALASARPVVAYDCDGAREVCLEGKTGFLVRPGNLTSLKQRLLQLAQDPDLRQRLGHQGQRFVQERFGVQRMVDDLHQLYLLLGGRRT